MFLLISLCVAYALPSSYHTTGQILDKLDNLANGVCRGVLTKLETKSVIAFDLKGSGSAAMKSYFLFGEHARELISPESGLRFIEKVCKDAKFAEVLKWSSFRIVLIANPQSRLKVEQGDYCLRTNEQGVDLNRNWDDHWEEGDCSNLSETCPGPSPFSEAETVELRDLLHAYKADLFLTVHSGALTLLSSYAYMPGYPKDNRGMLAVLDELNEDYCRCEVGSAASLLQYNCPGTCLDYALEVEKVAFSYAFEIYKEEIDLPTHFTQNTFLSFLQTTPSSCFMEVRTSKTNAECLAFFNPPVDEYEFYVEHWAAAYKELVSIVNQRLS
jgi:hypothetical protein